MRCCGRAASSGTGYGIDSWLLELATGPTVVNIQFPRNDSAVDELPLDHLYVRTLGDLITTMRVRQPGDETNVVIATDRWRSCLQVAGGRASWMAGASRIGSLRVSCAGQASDRRTDI
jgi:hypothetical protein